MDKNDAAAEAKGGSLALPWQVTPVPMMAALLVILCIYVVIYRLSVVQAGDVGWLLSCAEWLLDGQRMAIDFLEVNPPGAVLIYLPAAVAARILNVNSDIILELMIVTLVVANIYLFVFRILSECRNASVNLAFIVVLLLALLVFPGRDFAQREHIGLLLLLPWLIIIARPDIPASLSLRCVAGGALGAVAMTKPHLVLIPLAVELFRLVRTRDILFLFNVQNIVSILVVLAYGVIVYAIFPEYISNVMPHVMAIYSPVNWPFLNIILSQDCLLFLTFAVFSLIVRSKCECSTWPSDAILMAAFAAFLAVMLQMKGFRYHFLPAIVLSLISAALNVYLCSASINYNKRSVTGIVALLVVMCVGHSLNHEDLMRIWRTKKLEQVISKISNNPRILTVSSDIDVGFPVVRLVKGSYVQRQPFLWMAVSAVRLQMFTPESQWQPVLYDRYYKLELEILIEDISKGKPNVILVEEGPLIKEREDWSRLAWAKQDPRFVDLFSKYKRVATVHNVEVYYYSP